ncbi:MAG: hypothetical protein V1870_00585 [Candidatus Aenigmatarchaeota archaeon]
MKGAMKTLEVVLAASILLIGLGFVFASVSVKSVDNMKDQGYDAVSYLADTGVLRQYAGTGENIDTYIDPLVDYNFKGIFCTDQCNTTLPNNKDVVVIDYYISGYASSSEVNSDVKKFRLYLWEN